MDFTHDTWGTPSGVTPEVNNINRGFPRPTFTPSNYYPQQANYSYTPNHHYNPNYNYYYRPPINSAHCYPNPPPIPTNNPYYYHGPSANSYYPPNHQQQQQNVNRGGHQNPRSHHVIISRGRGRGGPKTAASPWRGRGRGGLGKRGRGLNRQQQPQQKADCPWLTPEILNEMTERNEAHQKALATSDPDDWRIYKACRRRILLKINDAKLLYNQKLEQDNPGVASSSSSSGFYCDTCDKSFAAEEKWNEHKAQHVTCKLDGCTFTSHPKVLLKHIEMQHSGNLFAKIKGYETPEQIEKWKSDRKKNYPTSENVAKKKEEKAERIKRGERIPMNRKPFSRTLQTPRGRNNSNNNGPQNKSDNRKYNNKSNFIPRQVNVNNNSSRSDGELAKIKDSDCKQTNRTDSTTPATTTSTNSPSCTSIVVLENFFSHIRVAESGELIGKKLTPWDIKTLSLCEKIAQGGDGRSMKKLNLLDGKRESDDESEHEVTLGSINCWITDEEDNDENLTLSKEKSPTTVLTFTPKITTTNEPITISAEQTKVLTINVTKEKSSSSPVLGGLVPYDSDSESEAPDEIPTVSMIEAGEIIDKVEKAETNISIDVEKEAPSKQPVSPKAEKSFKTTRTSIEANSKEDDLKRQIRKPLKRKLPRMSKLLRMLLENDIRRERNQILQVCRYIRENEYFDAVPNPTPE